jgi:excisionase family DNA binding protein
MKMQIEMYTVPEIAKLLRISRTGAYELVKSDDFPTIKIGKVLRVPADKFHDWLESQMLAK